MGHGRGRVGVLAVTVFGLLAVVLFFFKLDLLLVGQFSHLHSRGPIILVLIEVIIIVEVVLVIVVARGECVCSAVLFIVFVVEQGQLGGGQRRLLPYASFLLYCAIRQLRFCTNSSRLRSLLGAVGLGDRVSGSRCTY